MAFDLNTSPRYKYGAVPNRDFKWLAVAGPIKQSREAGEILDNGSYGLRHFEITHPFYVEAKRLTESTPEFIALDKIPHQNVPRPGWPTDKRVVELPDSPWLAEAPLTHPTPREKLQPGIDVPAGASEYSVWFAGAVQELYFFESALWLRPLEEDGARLDDALKQIETEVDSLQYERMNSWEGRAQQSHQLGQTALTTRAADLIAALKRGGHTNTECAAAVRAMIQEKASWVARLREYEPGYKADVESDFLRDVIRLKNYLDYTNSGALPHHEAAAMSTLKGSRDFLTPLSPSDLEQVTARVYGTFGIPLGADVRGLGAERGPRPAEHLHKYLVDVFIRPYEADIDQFNSLCRETRKSIDEVFTICFGGAPPNPQQVGWS